MFKNQELDHLQSLKRALVLRSEVNRLTLELECAHLRDSTAWVETGFGFFQKSRPVWLFVAPVMGFLFVRKAASAVRFCAKALAGWKIAHRAYAIWQQFQKGFQKDGGEVRS